VTFILVGAGVSAGAAVTLLITGPAVGVTAFQLASRRTGGWAAGILPVQIYLAAVIVGLAVNLLLPSVPPAVLRGESWPGEPTRWAAFAIVASLFLIALLRRGPRELFARLVTLPGGEAQVHDHGHLPNPESH
jgi:uncharacterized membrane protein YraQ (UPF0718 family)